MANDIKDVMSSLNDLLKTTKIDDVTSESTAFADLPEGYYLSEVEKAELTTSQSSGHPMVKIQFKIVEDGTALEADEDGNASLTTVKGSKNRKIFMYFVLKDDRSVRRFVSDMLKFEGEEPGVPLLDKQCFTDAELLNDALDILESSRVYVQITVSEKEDGTKQTWQNIISWKRATDLNLPE